jgi:hypothetical protein
MRRDGDGWLETAADDAAMAVQLALLVAYNIHCTPSNRPLCHCKHCCELAHPTSDSCELALGRLGCAPVREGLQAEASPHLVGERRRAFVNTPGILDPLKHHHTPSEQMGY